MILIVTSSPVNVATRYACGAGKILMKTLEASVLPVDNHTKKRIMNSTNLCWGAPLQRMRVSVEVTIGRHHIAEAHEVEAKLPGRAMTLVRGEEIIITSRARVRVCRKATEIL